MAELVASLTEDEAERLTLRISLKLGVLADSYESVMPLIREAIDRNAHEVLGYPSVGAYAADRFGDTLTRLGVEMRRDVVKELTAAGMSTRAIAPVVGVNNATVHRDLAAGVADATPEPSNVVGMDGKQYTRPAPKPEPRPADEEERYRREAWIHWHESLTRGLEFFAEFAEFDGNAAWRAAEYDPATYHVKPATGDQFDLAAEGLKLLRKELGL